MHVFESSQSYTLRANQTLCLYSCITFQLIPWTYFVFCFMTMFMRINLSIFSSSSFQLLCFLIIYWINCIDPMVTSFAWRFVICHQPYISQWLLMQFLLLFSWNRYQTNCPSFQLTYFQLFIIVVALWLVIHENMNFNRIRFDLVPETYWIWHIVSLACDSLSSYKHLMPSNREYLKQTLQIDLCDCYLFQCNFRNRNFLLQRISMSSSLWLMTLQY